jgi:hypothetical protein
MENTADILYSTQKNSYDKSACPLAEVTRMDFLSKMASKYIWWKTPEEALVYPQSVLAQIMNFGTWNDSCTLVQLFSESELKEVIENTKPGQFRPRSWHFWCYRLIGNVLPMPHRTFR